VFECDRDTVSSWLDDWQSGGETALADAAKSGRPLSLDRAAQSVVLQGAARGGLADSQFQRRGEGVVQDELKKGV